MTKIDPIKLPIIIQKHYRASSIFTPENLLREARRQKGIEAGKIPEVCILDPDGDIVQNLIETGQAIITCPLRILAKQILDY